MNDTTKILIRGGAILVSGIVLVAVTHKAIKSIKNKIQRKREQEREEEEAGMGQQQQTQEINQADTYNPTSDARFIRNKITGLNTHSRKNAVNDKILSLTNAKLKKLHSKYKSMYKVSIYKDLDDEYDLCDVGLMPFQNCFESGMNKLKSLGLY